MHPDPSPYDALLLVSFGGPEKPDDVVPFLENVTRGRGIPRERLEEVGEHYFLFGGRSPINDQNREFLAALREDLSGNGIDLPVYWGNRNWDPYLDGHPRPDGRGRHHPGRLLRDLGVLVVLRLPPVPREPRRGGRRRSTAPRAWTSCGTTSTTRASWTRWSTRRSRRWPTSPTATARARTWCSSRTRSRPRWTTAPARTARRTSRSTAASRTRSWSGSGSRPGTATRATWCSAPGPARRTSRGWSPTSTTTWRSWPARAARPSWWCRSGSSPTTWRSSTTSTPRPRPPRRSSGSRSSGPPPPASTRASSPPSATCCSSGPRWSAARRCSGPPRAACRPAGTSVRSAAAPTRAAEKPALAGADS